jgi:hypothetical protein
VPLKNVKTVHGSMITEQCCSTDGKLPVRLELQNIASCREQRKSLPNLHHSWFPVIVFAGSDGLE